jgi:hypothetical protein
VSPARHDAGVADETRWERRELAWPESAFLALEPHSWSQKHGYGGNPNTLTQFCQACERRRNRRTEIPYEWRGSALCRHCLEAGIRPVTFHAVWTILLPGDEVPAAGDRLEVEGTWMTVSRAAEETALADVEVHLAADGRAWGEGRSKVLRHPRLDVWLTDDPKPGA